MAGLLFVISGPSAAGKGTICKRVLAETDLELSVSATTRKPRPGEEHGREYYFLEEEEFVVGLRQLSCDGTADSSRAADKEDFHGIRD